MKNRKSSNSIATTLNLLEYNLAYLDQFAGGPFFLFFEYKYQTLIGGIAQLEQLQKIAASTSFNEEIRTLLSKYRIAFETIL